MKPPKYKIGNKVHCFRKETQDFTGFDFKGKITHINNTGTKENPDYEYSITNAPSLFFTKSSILIWEEEIIGLTK